MKTKMILLFALLAGIELLAKTLYVVSPVAKLLERPNMSAKGKTLKKGSLIKQIGAKGMFYKVKVGNEVGWVSKVFVSRKFPSQTRKNYKNLKQKKEKIKPRVRASTYNETFAARGKVKSEKVELNPNNKTDYDFDSIKWMEEQKVTKKDLNKFYDKTE